MIVLHESESGLATAASCYVVIIAALGGEPTEGERNKFGACTNVEFVLKLYPVKAYGMEKCRKPFHDQKNKNGQNCKERRDRQQQQDPIGAVHTQAHT